MFIVYEIMNPFRYLDTTYSEIQGVINKFYTAALQTIIIYETFISP